MSINGNVPTCNSVNFCTKVARLKFRKQGSLAVLVENSFIYMDHDRVLLWKSNHGDGRNDGDTINACRGRVIPDQINGVMCIREHLPPSTNNGGVGTNINNRLVCGIRGKEVTILKQLGIFQMG